MHVIARSKVNKMKGPVIIIVTLFLVPMNLLAQHQQVRDGFAWLGEQQAVSGYWGNNPELRVRDTTEALETYRLFSQTDYYWEAGILWLESTSMISNDYLSRIIFLLSMADRETTLLKADLTAAQNSDYG